MFCRVQREVLSDFFLLLFFCVVPMGLNLWQTCVNCAKMIPAASSTCPECRFVFRERKVALEHTPGQRGKKVHLCCLIKDLSKTFLLPLHLVLVPNLLEELLASLRSWWHGAGGLGAGGTFEAFDHQARVFPFLLGSSF
jgi:hypothetical protein